MKNFNFKYIFFAVVAMVLTVSFLSCNTEDVNPEVPTLEITLPNGNTSSVLPFDQNEGSTSVTINANRPWTAVSSDESWLVATPDKGDGNATFTIQVTANDGVGREGTITVSTVLMKYVITVSQAGAGGSLDVIYFDNLDQTPATQTGTAWPSVTAFTGWNPTGSGATNVTYGGGTATVRNNSNSTNYANASGVNNILFGNGGSFIVNSIALTSTQTKLNLSFGTLRNEYGASNNDFNTAELIVSLSKDGTSWTPLTYTRDANDKWDLATADFTLKSATSTLYIKFEATIASSIRIDDIKLVTGNGGQEVDLDSTTPPSNAELKSVSYVWSTYASQVPANNNTVKITEDIKIKGLVVSHKEANLNTSNIEDYLFAVQDGTAANSGLTINITDHTFAVGDEVEVVLKDATLKNYQGLLQVAGTATKISSGNTVTPVTITADQLGSYQSMLVKIVDVQMKDAAATGKWYNSVNSGTNVFETKDGKEFTMYVKSKAKFATDNDINTNSGEVTGIGGIYGTTLQIQPRMLSDLNLTSARFTVTSPIVVTTAATSAITQTTATLNGSYTGTQYTPTGAGFEYKLSTATTYTDVTATLGTTFTANLTGLTADTNYDVRAYVVANGSKVYGSDITFKTSATVAPAAITIPQILALTVGDKVDATADRMLTAIVVSDVDNGNVNNGIIVLQTEGSSTAGNGICLYTSGLNGTGAFKVGDKVDVTLKQNVATYALYNGLKQITGVTDADINKVGSATVTPTTITYDKLADFQSMLVKVAGVQSVDTSGTWSGTKAFTVGADDTKKFNVYTRTAATFATTTMNTGKGDIIGVASVNSNAGQLMPRSATDGAGLTGTRDGSTTPPTTYDWTHTFASGELGTSASPKTSETFDGLLWNFTPTWAGSAYLGFESSGSARGLQIGSGSNPARVILLSTTAWTQNVKTVKVNASTAANATATLAVSVNGTVIATKDLTNTAAEYEFTLASPVAATSIEIKIEQPSTSKGLYVKAISIAKQ